MSLPTKKLTVWLTLALFLSIGLLIPAQSGEKKGEQEPHWSYKGETGPENWYKLKKEWAIAKDGKLQSPINVLPFKAALSDYTAPVLAYNETPLNVTNNGHTIQVDYAGSAPAMATALKKTYKLKQFHFHTPSEHRINGKKFDMEIHFVHEKSPTELLVLGVFLQAGKENPLLAKIWKNFPDKEGTKMTAEKINPKGLLPDFAPATGKKLYYYKGSLTTPGCAEIVEWYVYDTPMEASKEQIDAFRKIFPDNARPPQPDNNRSIILIS